MPNTKKALLVTTVSGFVPQFEMNNVRLLQDMGYEVHYAANYNTPAYGTDNHRLDGTGIIRHQIDFVRSPFRPENLTVYRQLKALMKRERFQLVHCHTPMGGVMARLAAHATHTSPVIYTAHGFHFFKGARLINWLCYYPMERFLSRYTDQQICINQEDYQFAKRKFHAKYVDYVPGVGINLARIPKFSQQEILRKKEALGLPMDRTLLLASGELIKRKNHETILRTIARMKDPSKIHYILCGHGELNEYLHQLVQELNIADYVTFLGYREDMLEIFQIADIFLFPSYQEGLPMALLEAMASGLPVICSDIRGSRDLMGDVLRRDGNLEYFSGGIMISSADDVEGYCQAVEYLLKFSDALPPMGEENIRRSGRFSTACVQKRMRVIYKRLLS